MKSTVERFSDRVENYVKYRPGYPPELLAVFHNEMGLHTSSVIADIGSGTGISAKIFLENGNRVYGVEPNAAMRAAAENFLQEFAEFRSVDGTAEKTGLPDGAVDFVVAAQAFHWFDREKTRAEFARILRPNGFAALVWNERQLDTTPFLRGFEELLKKYGTDYEKVRHDNLDKENLKDFFRTDFRSKSFLNAQTLDFEGVKGRMLSSSYIPAAGDSRFEPMNAELRLLFEKYAESGKIQILYNTNIFYTRL
ncbi:MAG: class I SAM-dependent methyltransferase [Acidobacteria bacterium]|nr:class I SAM-dependent methyltransferase [Acidobacteriota bacterium]